MKWRTLILVVVILVANAAESAAALWARVTAYCGGPCQRCGTTGRTTTGRSARSRGIAVNRYRRRFRLGRKLWIEGFGWSVVDDTGAHVRSLDVRMRRHRDAVRWGVRRVRIRVHRF